MTDYIIVKILLSPHASHKQGDNSDLRSSLYEMGIIQF